MNDTFKIPDGKMLRVAISGKSGCGNTTVSSILAKMLDITLINYTFRSIAAETNQSLSEIIELARSDDSFDIRVDTRQVELAMQDSCVLGSRLAIWMLKEADFKIYLTADSKVRAERIHRREGGSLAEIESFTQKRDAEDSARYQKLYHIDNNDFAFADLVIDAGIRTADEIIALILSELSKKGLLAHA